VVVVVAVLVLVVVAGSNGGSGVPNPQQTAIARDEGPCG
jgi:hypothetical protein